MLLRRIISAAVLGAALYLIVCRLPSIGIWLAIVAVSSATSLEFYGMLGTAQLPSFRFVGVLCGAGLISATFFSLSGGIAGTNPDARFGADLECVTLMAIVLALLIRVFPQKLNTQPIVTVGCTLLGILYVPYLLNFFTRLAFEWEPVPLSSSIGRTGRWLVVYLIVLVKGVDTGAFLVGTAVGRHKLLPRISPGKTWEGCVGGVAAGILISLLFFWLGRSGGSASASFGKVTVHAADAIVLGVLLAVVGIVGDLAESLIKRAVGAKDSGRSIPGIGGLLDIMDSLLFTAPVFYLYARLFL